MDKALKQRLVGASVLVALAVVVLPMLLGGQPGGPQESRSIELPPKPAELSFETRRFPIGEQADDEPSTVQAVVAETAARDDEMSPARQEGDGMTPGEPVMEPGGPAQEAVTASDQHPPANDVATPPPDEALVTISPRNTPDVAPARAEPPPSRPDGRYLVQVASFSSTANANRLTALLKDNGLPVVSDTVDTAAGRLHRVRVGPYSDRDTAAAAIDTLNTRVPDLNPRILDLRPDETAAVAEPSDPLVRWVVQVGSFAGKINADNLVFRLRDAGFRASTAAVSDSSGTAWKVRVGPVIERQEAVDLAASIKRQLDLDGLVMSAD